MRKTILCKKAIAYDIATVGPTFNVLTLIEQRYEPITYPMPSGCATCCPQWRVLYSASDIAGVE